MAVEAIARAPRLSRRGGAAFRASPPKAQIGGERVLLLLPGTYMNESGRAVAEAAHFYKLPVGDIVVFHDELDLPPAKLRVKVGGGIAGHNGLRSITAHVGNDYQARAHRHRPSRREGAGARARARAILPRRARLGRGAVRDHRGQCRPARGRQGRDASRTRCISRCRPRASAKEALGRAMKRLDRVTKRLR